MAAAPTSGVPLKQPDIPPPLAKVDDTVAELERCMQERAELDKRIQALNACGGHEKGGSGPATALGVDLSRESRSRSRSPRPSYRQSPEVVESGVLRGFPICDVLAFQITGPPTMAQQLVGRLMKHITGFICGHALVSVPCPHCTRNVLNGALVDLFSKFHWDTRSVSAQANVRRMNFDIVGMTTPAEVATSQRILAELQQGTWGRDTADVALLFLKELAKPEYCTSLTRKLIGVITGLPEYNASFLHAPSRCACFGRMEGNRVLPFGSSAVAAACGANEVILSREFSRAPLPDAKWQAPMKMHVLSKGERRKGGQACSDPGEQVKNEMSRGSRASSRRRWKRGVLQGTCVVAPATQNVTSNEAF